MTDEEQTRDEIEEVVKENEPVEAVIETVIEETVQPPVKTKAKLTAKPKIKITKQPVEPIKEEELKDI